MSTLPPGQLHPYHPVGFLDVSKYQWGIDTNRAMAAGVRALIIRGGYGVYADTRFSQHKATAERAGLPWGAYWYWRPHHSAAEQARKAKNVIGRRPPLGVFVDFEQNQRIDPWPANLSKSAVSRMIWETLEEFDRAFLDQSGVYSSPGFWAQWVTPAWMTKMRLYSRALWVANWYYNFTRQPRKPSGWPRWDLWQFSGEVGPWAKRARELGVSGDDDVDVDVFNGSWEEFRLKFHLPVQMDEPAVLPATGFDAVPL